MKVHEDEEPIFSLLYFFGIIKNIELVSSVKDLTKTRTKFKWNVFFSPLINHGGNAEPLTLNIQRMSMIF